MNDPVRRLDATCGLAVADVILGVLCAGTHQSGCQESFKLPISTKQVFLSLWREQTVSSYRTLSKQSAKLCMLVHTRWCRHGWLGE